MPLDTENKPAALRTAENMIGILPLSEWRLIVEALEGNFSDSLETGQKMQALARKIDAAIRKSEKARMSMPQGNVPWQTAEEI
jgi:hypothetical protein